MKLFIIFALLFLSCDDNGTVVSRSEGTINGHAIKVFSYCLGDGDWVKVAFIDDKINSTNYNEGKTKENVIIVNNPNQKPVVINGEIIMNNDSLILIKKK